MLEDITNLLDENLVRVDNLVSLYGKTTRGRKAVKATDILRASIVLLHASMEDYLRSLLIWKIDKFDQNILKDFSFLDEANRLSQKKKITLGELSIYRNKTVAEVIEDSVKFHLENYHSFSDLGEVKKALNWCGISHAAIKEHDFGKLHEMISRRHHIVHRADRNDVTGGQGNHPTKSLSKKQLENYIKSVKDLKDFVSGNLS